MATFLWYALALLIVIGIARFSVSLFALLAVIVAIYEIVTRNHSAVSASVNSASESVTTTASSVSGFLAERASTVHVSEPASVMIILGIGVLVVIYSAVVKRRRRRLSPTS